MKKMDDEKQSLQATAATEVEPLVPVEQTTVSPEEWEELKAKATKADENWERLVRTTADFDNYRKRAIREKQDAVRYANESLLEKLTPVLDAFDKAISPTQPAGPDSTGAFQAGVHMIYQQLKSVLTDAGLEEVDATGKEFDPNFHEAVSQVPTSDVPEGRVVQQLRKGYRLRDRLLRPATVIVASQPAAK
jgi:molecular chaperone GrpE